MKKILKFIQNLSKITKFDYQIKITINDYQFFKFIIQTINPNGFFYRRMEQLKLELLIYRELIIDKQTICHPKLKNRQKIIKLYILKFLMSLIIIFISKTTSYLFAIMRISTSPSSITPKIVQKVCILPENIRSNSLSNTTLYSSKIIHQPQNLYVSPYYNVNSSIRYFPKQQVNLYAKNTSKQNRISQNPLHMQADIKNLLEKVQTIEKRLKSIEKYQIKQKKTQKQNEIYLSLQQRIQKGLQQKIIKNNQKINLEIKKLDEQIRHKIQNLIQKQNLKMQENLNSQENVIRKYQLQNNERRKIKFLIEEKIKEQIFKIKIHLQNQITKIFSLLKNNLQNNNSLLLLSKSKLKYKYRPIQIIVKNQVYVKKNQINDHLKLKKDDKQNLSTAYSSAGSSQSQEDKLQKKVIQIEHIQYYIDKEGYLLDQNGFYLVDQEEKMIRIDKSLIKKLKENKIIGE